MAVLRSAWATVTRPEITSEAEKQARVLLIAAAEAFQRAQQKRVTEIAAQITRASGAGTPVKVIHIGIPATIIGGQAAGQLVDLMIEAVTKKFHRD